MQYRHAGAFLAVLVASASLLAGWSNPPPMKPKTTANGPDTLRYSFYTPVTEAGKKYPLVVHLHSLGTGSQNLDHTQPIFAMLTDPQIQAQTPHFIMGPVCPQQTSNPSAPHYYTTWRWVKANWDTCSYSIATVPISDPMQWVIDEIKYICQNYPIDTNRIHVTGGSMGGMGTWDAIGRNPDLFASASPLSGPGDPTQADKLAHVAIWAFLRQGDQVTDPCGPQTMIAAIRTGGGLQTLTEFDAGESHLYSQIWWPNAYEYTPEQVPWMLRQVKSTAVPTKVTGLTATADGSYKVNIAWQAASDAVGDPLRIHYQVYRGTTLVATVDSTGYADTSSTLQENAVVKYTVKAYNDNSYVGPASDEASVTMPADNTAPALLDALDIGDSTKVLMTFTERVSAATAQSAANYALTPTLAVSGATMQTGNKSVLLTVAKMTLHQAYTVTVNNVKDVTGRNTIAANSTTQFTHDYRPGLKYEYFEFAGYPTSCSIMDTAKPVSTGVSDWMGLAPAHRSEKFGFRMTGAINAFETGLYKFSTNSQQGTRMYIDGKLVVDNDYTVSFVEGSINLTRGKHSVMCLYYATGSTCVWESRWEGPGQPRMVFLPTVLMHNPDAPPPVAAAPAARTALPLSATLALVTNHRTATIRFSVPAKSGVHLGVYDLRGRLVRTLVAGRVEPGSHSVAFDGVDDAGKILSRGQYLVGFHAGNVSLNRILTLAE